MTVRDLRWEDFTPLVEGYWALYDEVLEDPEIGIGLFDKRPTLGEEAVWFASLFKDQSNGTAVATVAEEDGHAVGLCTVRPEGPVRETRHIGVLGISVDRAYRNRGLGRAMMVHALDRCRGKFELIELTLFATNLRGRHLYESLGFRLWGSQPRGIRRGERYIDHLSMQLVLAPPSEPAAPPREAGR